MILRLCMGLLLLLTSCRSGHLSVQTTYFRRELLASYHVGTPDLLLDAPLVGQRMLIQWSLPEDFMQYSDLHLEVAIRYRNRLMDFKVVPICMQTGFYTLDLIDEDYLRTQGILTYRVDLIGNASILETWKHQLWVDLIKVGEEDSGEENEEEL